MLLALNRLRSKLIAQGRYTDAVDEIIMIKWQDKEGVLLLSISFSPVYYIQRVSAARQVCGSSRSRIIASHTGRKNAPRAVTTLG